MSGPLSLDQPMPRAQSTALERKFLLISKLNLSCYSRACFLLSFP